MRNIYLVFFLAIITFGFSQKKEFGIIAGPNFSNIRGMDSPLSDYKYAVGFLAGISFEYSIRESFSIKSNLLFERKSNQTNINSVFMVDGEEEFVNADARNNFDFITLPVMAKYNFGKNNSFFINGGPYFSYLLNVKTHFSVNSESENFKSTTIDNSDSYKSFDAGLAFGFGKRFDIDSKNALTVEIRNSLGLLNISKLGTFENKGHQTISFGIVTGWSFGL